MAQPSNIEVLNRYKVAPPEGSVPPTSLPLSFFDFPWLPAIPMKRLFFYYHPYPTHHFIQTVIPTLKTSLSLTLQHFFPFAANLIFPSKPQIPHILYVHGDSVEFTVAESTADFTHLTADYSKDVKDLRPLVPELPSARDLDDGSRAVPLIAIQVTILPCHGFSIGVIFHHVAADGRAFHHLIKSWASICRTGGFLEEPEPIHERVGIEDTHGLEKIFLNQWWDLTNWESKQVQDKKPNLDIYNDFVKATIKLGQAQIHNLKNWVSKEYKNELAMTHTSTFVVICSLIWVCLLESQSTVISYRGNEDEDKLCYFIFSADCRNRYGFSIPTSYFGNCLAFCFVSLNLNELVGELGFVQAMKAIGSKIKELEDGALKGAEKWMLSGKEIMELAYHVVIVGASPYFGVYKTDFGLGKLKKTEVVHVGEQGVISLADSRDEEGGIEVGLALPKDQMDNFNVIFRQYLELK
ncbi:hypothetical protein L6164_023342 [Bauhinia variegata]|uniref:Uncharacterized protein n=1 Tax=Bauhinia variegata TaxID=167791 RepID=A0ACB9ML98_BAUVA|nr:hypothetical protein L6164_023342 [Bauhinia variegata]